MKLSKKTFLYSALISGVIIIIMITYFILMLPSLYVDYMKRSNLNSIKKIQERYIEDGNYNNIKVSNPTATSTIKIPIEGREMFVANKFVTVKVTINNDELYNALEKLRNIINNNNSLQDIQEEDFDFQDVVENIFKDKLNNEEEIIKLEEIESNDDVIFEKTSDKVYMVNDNTIIFEYNLTDGSNYYTTYLACSKEKEEIVLSILPVMTPNIYEIRPIVLRSLPMILSLVVLLVLVFTFIFSKKIVKPIEKLSDHAQFIKNSGIRDIEPISIEGFDEIAILGTTLNELYSNLNNTLEELEIKNRHLAEENERQEVFLRASSHQLKTPVAAGLLLVDGMINKVGKYRETGEYLPKVKDQFLSMRKIIDDILSLNRKTLEVEALNITEILSGVISQYELKIDSKSIKIISNLKEVKINTDEKLIFTIFDNLVSNAVNYTENNRIEIQLNNKVLKIRNYGEKIEQSILPHIFEPFVSSNSKNKGHGLGLYIVSYYSNILGFHVDINNLENGVEVVLNFEK